MQALDPVAAYDLVAPGYAEISAARRPYLSAVEDLIAGNMDHQPQSMLDVGAGDGSRSLRIAQHLGIAQLTLLEPSGAMRARWPSGSEVWPIRVQELSSKRGSFDLITCLWNVLGHVFPAPARSEAISGLQRLLAPNGMMFIDISHRYNMRHYGQWSTLGRIVGDAVAGRSSGCDVQVSWKLPGGEVSTSGHVFTSGEFEHILRTAGLRVERRFSIDYASGRICRSKYGGHLLYQLRHSFG